MVTGSEVGMYVRKTPVAWGEPGWKVWPGVNKQKSLGKRTLAR